MEINSTVGINLIGLASNKATIIPIQVGVKNVQNNPNDFGVGAVGSALAKELPYIRSIICRLFPEMFLFLNDVQLQLSADIDNVYDCKIVDTASAQLPLALSLCILLRKSLDLPCIENFAATGTLDPLGFITQVENLLIKRIAAQSMFLIEPSEFQHMFDALEAINCLVVR